MSKCSNVWAFIDYENIGSLEQIDLLSYEKTFVFLGSNQSTLKLGQKKYAKPVHLELITLKKTKANNLDFHLSFYVGKWHASSPGDTVFHVISKDTGFDPLIKHINGLGRKCLRVFPAPLTPEQYKKLTETIINISVKKRPQKPDTLKNFIKSHLKITSDSEAATIIKHLCAQKILMIENERLTYL